MEFLNFEKYSSLVKKLEGGHWSVDTISIRWDYHLKTIELIKALNISDPKKVLEMGTMGISCVMNSDTIDFMEEWDFPDKKPTYVHDCRQLPWPVSNFQYELFVSLRAYQHLVPVQKEAFKEAIRISRKVIIVVPREYNNNVIPDSKGITYEDFVNFNEGIHPNIFLPTAFGDLYFWDRDNPSKLKIIDIFKDVNRPNVVYQTKKVKEYVGVLRFISLALKKIK